MMSVHPPEFPSVEAYRVERTVSQLSLILLAIVKMRVNDRKVNSADRLAGPTLVSRGEPLHEDTSIEMRVKQLSATANEAESRFDRLGHVKDIEKAIECWSQVLAVTPEGHAEKPQRLLQLRVSFCRRFTHVGELEDVNKAIEYLTQAVLLYPDGGPNKRILLNCLGVSYFSRFERLGELSDLNKSIEYKTQAVLLTPDEDAYKPTRLSNLGLSYWSRFMRLGELADLNKAIECQTQAVLATPDGDLGKSKWLNNLGNSYLSRFWRLDELEDLNKAIEYETQAVQLTPEDHPDKPIGLNSLGATYGSRFRRLGELADLNKAIEYQSRAVLLTPDGHAYKPVWLNNLGTSCVSRFMHFGGLADLDKAIEHQTQAVLATPDWHAAKPVWLNNLGTSYQSRFEHLGEVSDLISARLSFQHGAELVTILPESQIKCAREWAKSLSQLGQSPQSAYERCMQLVPHLIWLGTTISQRYNLVPEINDLATEAAAWAISAQQYNLALEWLEEGRSIVWNQILQLRTPFDQLYTVDPELAQRLKDTASKLESAGLRQAEVESVSPLLGPDTAAHHHHLASEWEQLVAMARQLPGFEHFLRPQKAATLKLAATTGPVVVINTHSTRCDALVLFPNSDRIGHIPLREFSLEEAMDHRVLIESLAGHRGNQERGFRRLSLQPQPGERFRPMLTTLWLDVVKPILDHLGYTSQTSVDNLPHVTWCTTGELAFLPLHAAGCYDEAQPNAYDLILSSYTPTLSALLMFGTPVATPDMGVLAVSQANTRGFCPLPYTIPELTAIKEHAKAVRFRQLEGTNGTVEAVLEALEEHSWVHLACHATQNPINPTQSAFHLHNGNLTLEAITKCTFTNKGLAFLSACQTAAGDNKLPDEALHLAAGMLMAGYPSVIATMWSIYDEDAPGVAGEVYADLFKEGQMDHRQAARALHKAVVKLRDKVGVNEFKRWVPFIHIGV